MSEDLRVTGAITITPPVPWTSIVCPVDWLDIPHADYGRTARPLADRRDALLRFTQTETDTDEGVLVLRSLTAIIAADYPGIDLVRHMQEIIDRIPADHTLSGHLECVWGGGEDIWRIAVRDRTAVEIRPAWPDDADRYVLATAAGGDSILLGPHGQVLVTADTVGLTETDGWQRLYRRVPAGAGDPR